jgi:lipid-binding SYLF domain-containing protein
MKTKMLVLVPALLSSLALAGKAWADKEVSDAEATLAVFLKRDPGMKKFVDESAGYVVFPNVGKAAVGVGGAHGDGVLFEHGGRPVAKASMTQVTIGLQLGGQSYSEVIFFENQKALSDFKRGNFAMAAGVSAVALANGAAQGARYQSGVAVFTATKSGLMFEASVGGQKFTIKPLK